MSVYTSVVTSKGQLVIPAVLRKRYGIKQGTVISFIEHDGSLVLQPITSEFVRTLRGSLSAKDETHGENRS
jgi:AbrB family looped-hinge helix DNA binding protein